MKKCPHCGLISHDTALRCDSEYELQDVRPLPEEKPKRKDHYVALGETNPVMHSGLVRAEQEAQQKAARFGTTVRAISWAIALIVLLTVLRRITFPISLAGLV